MKRLLVTVAFVIAALPACAAIEYEFLQKQSSDDNSTPPAELTAKVTVDGVSSRYDFIGGNMYPPGTYAISTDGARRVYFVDPTHKWYTEVDSARLATSLGASNIKISNLQSETVDLSDTLRIADVDARHQRQTVSYDITVPIRGIPVTQRVRTEIDSWTTNLYPELRASILTSRIATGNPEVDQLLEKENGKIGFPLRQIVKIHVSWEVAVRSKIEVPPTRTITRDTSIISIRQVSPGAATFTVPVSYRRADQPDLPRTAAKVLTFDPAGN